MVNREWFEERISWMIMLRKNTPVAENELHTTASDES